MAGFSVTIQAVDQVTAKVAAINKSLASITAPMTRLNASLGKLADTAGLTKLTAGMLRLEQQVVATASSMARAVPALGALTGAASLAGLVRLTTQWGELGTKVGFAAQRMDISVSRLTALQGAARLAGSSSEALTSGMRGLQQTLHDAVGGRNAQAVVLFGKLGVSFRKGALEARNAADVLPELADRIAAIKDPQYQAMVATELFGSAAEELLPFLRRGAEGIREWEAEARKYGLITDGGAEAARKFTVAQTHLSMAVEGLGNKAAVKLAPVLVPLLERLALWIGQHSDQIASFFERVAKAIEKWVDSGGPERLIDGLEKVGKVVDAVAQSVGGWQTAGELALAFYAGKWVLGMLTAIGKVSVAATGLRSTLLMRGAVPLMGGYLAHEALSAADPNDKMGSWIDRNVPGAAWLDDWFARHTGLGRTYDEQRRVDPQSTAGLPAGAPMPGLPPRASGGPAPDWGNWQNSAVTQLLDRINGGARLSAPLGGGSATAAPGSAASAARLMESRLGQGPAQVNGFLREQGVNLDAARNAWCAAFVGANLHALGIKGSGSNVATSYLTWGQHVDGLSQEGDVLVKARGHRPGETGGHVGMATGRERTVNGQRQIEMVSGNQGNKVALSWENASALEVRRAPAPALPVPGPAAQPLANGGAQDGPAGRVAVDVTHRGDPGNTQVAVRASGAAELDGLRVERTSLLAGVP